ncbi:DoxX family membrane protein [Blastopirellula sp. JC732]|uniref:DoxX family membrane protein n=1 Tax=Blastopirellula sediminis TaxID=2894196 RepID=A0A9X1MUC0_9BACT|nr:TQO small subunit DoxD [Blastopirellula sediminis]MCC9604459.1 DoxX family membrane protein [Blastopirellula sediminis]MCC9632242.1 DoxX family membrane protein [Blastopirellula sediminis]
MLTIVIIVALRLVIGWHFFMEGSKKIKSGEFSSAGFLRNAKGPFADYFRNLSDDPNGRKRLDRDYVLGWWDYYGKQANAQFGFDAAGQEKVGNLYKIYAQRLTSYMNDIAEDRKEYFLEVERLAKARARADSDDLQYELDRLDKKDKELFGKLQKWTKDIKQLQDEYVEDLNRLGRAAGATSTFSAPDPNQSRIDVVVTYVTFGSGVLLILGLFTRIAALAAAGFLLQVMAAQFPGSYGAEPVYYQSVEFTALLLLAAIGAGKFAGLDFILGAMCRRCCAQATSPNEGE